jgi:membrane-associated phospholipid phosphatase
VSSGVDDRQAEVSGYRLVDYLTQGYLAFAGLFVLVFHGDRLLGWPRYLGAHAATMVAVHILIRVGNRNAFLRMLRAFYPMILFSFLYVETHVLDDLIRPTPLDGWFIDADQRLFGTQLCRTMMQRLPYRLVSELLYAAYASYYVMVFGVGMLIYLRHRQAFYKYMTVVAFVFYICYAIYAFLPVMGPIGTVGGETFHGQLAEVRPRTMPPQLDRGPMRKVMGFIYGHVEPEKGGAAFPSSHVAVALATLCFSWTCLRRLRYLHLAAVVLLCLATVYCGYHYAVDVLAGLLAAAVLVPLGAILYDRLDPGGRPVPTP